MAVLVWDERAYKLYVRCRPDEKFKPDEQLEKLVSDAAEISGEYSVLAEKLTILFGKCNEWNVANDKKFAEAFAKKQTKFKMKK